MRLDLLEDMRVLSKTEEKAMQLVKNYPDQEFYIKRVMRDCAELQTYRQLVQHSRPDIPMLYGATRRGETCILAGELINGTILEYVLSERPLDDAAIHHIIQQLLSAIEHLHSLQPPVIHRNIKPGDIIALKHLEIRLIDFETARIFKQDKNRDTRVIGSADYVSPEQYGLHQGNYRSDIYAIGAVLRTMAQRDVMAKDIHSPFQHVIETYIQLGPDKRYQNVGELQKALGYCKGKFLPHAPVSVLLSQLPGIRRDFAVKRLLFFAYCRLCITLGALMTATPSPSSYSLICQRVAFGLCLATIPAIMVNAGNARELLLPQDHERAPTHFFKDSILWFLCAFITISLLMILTAILESLLQVYQNFPVSLHNFVRDKEGSVQMRLEVYDDVAMLSHNDEKDILLAQHMTGSLFFVKEVARAKLDFSLYQLLQSRPHEYLINVIDLSYSHGKTILIEGFVNGCTLEYRPNQRRLSIEEYIGIMLQLFTAVGHPHAQILPIVHRGTKPDNILIGKRHVVLIDFEIVKLMTTCKSVQHSGSIDYVAPEQYYGLSNQQSGTYSMGVLLEELRTHTAWRNNKMDILLTIIRGNTTKRQEERCLTISQMQNDSIITCRSCGSTTKYAGNIPVQKGQKV